MARSRWLWFLAATTALGGGKASARPAAKAAMTAEPPAKKQSRRRNERARAPQDLPGSRSPCGRHVVVVSSGVVRLDGSRLHPDSGTVHILSPPAWRSDGRALAWIERRAGRVQLVVVPEIGAGAEIMPWVLPGFAPGDRVFWAGSTRIVVGADALAPRAVASWTVTGAT